MALGAENPFDRIPPHDSAAEAGVLGSMLWGDPAAGLGVELLTADDFYVPRHQLLFKLFAELYDKQPDLDQVFVESELARRGLAERVGGVEILAKLMEETPNPVNIERYCRIVRERAVERELLQGAAKIVQMCQGPSSGEEHAALLERSEGLIFGIADRRTSQEPVTILSVLDRVLTEAERHVQARREGRELPSQAVPTGFQEMDRIFAGGLWPGEVVIVAARPSVGKTTLAINIARKVACRPAEKKPVGVAIFSLEMPKEQVSKNMLCAEARIVSGKMRTYAFDEEDYETVKLAAQNLRTAPIFIDDSPGLTPGDLRARARRLCHREKVGLVVVDYLQLMQSGRHHDNREQAVAELSRQVKQIARELGVPLLLLSQLRRPIQGQENHAPNLSDLRESGAIEQDADVVIMLHREQDEQGIRSRETKAIVQKNRNGETGEVRLSFFPEYFRFESYAPEIGAAQSAAGA